MVRMKSKGAVVASLILGSVLIVGTTALAEQRPVRGLEVVEEPLPWFDAERNYPTYDGSIRGKRPDAVPAVTSIGRPPMDEPISLALSRYRYPVEDGHIDAIVRFDMDVDQQPGGELHITLRDANGQSHSESTIAPIPGAQLFFSYELPVELDGDAGELVVSWQRDDGAAAEAAASFELAAPVDAEPAGRIALDVPNATQAHVSNAPMTVGVPFPRGVLESTDNLRLVDAEGDEIPLQAEVRSTWSRYGSIRWVHCDFTVDLGGEPVTLYLEYGPDVTRQQRDEIEVDADGGRFPTVEAGRLRIDDEGVAFDLHGDGNHRTMLDAAAMTGAFVEHVRGVQSIHARMYPGMVFTMPQEPTYEIEEIGSEKVVLRAEGWLIDEESGERFCQYVNRYVLHRDSPVARIFHTWVFTGDGNRDVIRNMGWRFALGDLEPIGFLADFDEPQWLEGDYLLQHESDAFTLYDLRDDVGHRRIPDDDYDIVEFAAEAGLNELDRGGRAPGVMAAQAEDGARVYLGVQDFWQNFPGSLRIEDGAMTFYQWPRFAPHRERRIGADTLLETWRLWWVHEGETLSFRLPQVVTEGPIFHDASRSEPHMSYANPEGVNAQGIAKTAEMWLYLADEGQSSDEAARVLQGLNEETLRAIVDPHWMAESGAFYEVASRDEQAFPEQERVYEDSVTNIQRMIERMGIYGKWIYGDLLMSPNLDDRTAGNYRAFRKAHWGWPFSWTPFVRSGDPGLLRTAQAATRMMTDIAFVHYVSDDVREHFEGMPPKQLWDLKPMHRHIGWHNRNLIPWAGYWGPSTRLYVDQADYLWDAWHVTGYHRARDVIEAWAEQTKIEEPFIIGEEKMGRGPITAAPNRERWPANLQKQYIEMYDYTADPWFLAAAHAIDEMNRWRVEHDDWTGHFWLGGYETYQRYTGSAEHEAFYRTYLENWGDWQHLGWHRVSTLLPSATFGYRFTGDEYYLRRAAGLLDLARWALYDGDELPEYYCGYLTTRRPGTHMNFTSWFHLWAPWAISAFKDAGGVPENPIPVAFNQQLADGTRVAVHKEEGEELEVRLNRGSGNFRTGHIADDNPSNAYAITGPDGSTVMEGDEGGRVVLAAEMPAGTYIVDVDGGALRLPITPPDTPEVVMLNDERQVARAGHYTQYWFHVPEDVDSFWIEFENTRFIRQDIRQLIVWDPDGEQVWAHRYHVDDHDATGSTIRAEVTVSADQAGRLWHVTLPGERSVPFRLDPQLPGLLSHDPVRWFDPDAGP